MMISYDLTHPWTVLEIKEKLVSKNQGLRDPRRSCNHPSLFQLL